MALVKELHEQALDRKTHHTEVECTYSIIKGDDGSFLQLDTYGSAKREMPGKKSQSIRLTTDAIAQLKKIIKSI